MVVAVGVWACRAAATRNMGRARRRAKVMLAIGYDRIVVRFFLIGVVIAGSGFRVGEPRIPPLPSFGRDDKLGLVRLASVGRVLLVGDEF
jgi:hypothetical protein